jgi:hypothetical protein
VPRPPDKSPRWWLAPVGAFLVLVAAALAAVFFFLGGFGVLGSLGVDASRHDFAGAWTADDDTFGGPTIQIRKAPGGGDVYEISGLAVAGQTADRASLDDDDLVVKGVNRKGEWTLRFAFISPEQLLATLTRNDKPDVRLRFTRQVSP